MMRLVRLASIVALALCVPLLPFVIFGELDPNRVARWLSQPRAAIATSAAIVALLSADVLLPVPSSLVNTWAGARLGLLPGTLVCWLGMTLGGLAAFGLARMVGRPLVARWVRASDAAQLERLAGRHAALLVVLTRALPVLAEATMLLLGATEVGWRRIFWPLAASNLGLAAAYAAWGGFAVDSAGWPAALAASVAVPLLATTIVRWRWRRANNGEVLADEPTIVAFPQNVGANQSD